MTRSPAEGTDTISGGAGDDIIIASPGNDTMNGDADSDQIKIIGRIVNDTITANQTNATTLVVTFNGTARTYTVNTMELVLIDGGLGDDVVAINVVDSVAPANSLPFYVIGNAPNASDRLIVNDDGLGDLVIHRQASDGRSGSIVIGPTTRAGGVNSAIDPPKVRVAYESIERVDITPMDPQGRTGTDAGGQLIVFHYDTFEQNDSLTTATSSVELRSALSSSSSVSGISIRVRSLVCPRRSPASPVIPIGTSSARTESAPSASKSYSSKSTSRRTVAPACLTTAI